MRLRVLALVLALAVVVGLPAGIAGAHGPERPDFTAQAAVVQHSAGTVMPILVEGIPFPVGVTLSGEVFAGTVDECAGRRCAHLEQASLTVTQNAMLFFTGQGPQPGAITWEGTVHGTFVITRKSKPGDNFTGAYTGTVSGTMIPDPSLPDGAFFITGQNTSNWWVTDATKKFDKLRGAGGSITADLVGVFPGGETATLTIVGFTPEDD